MSNIEKIRQEIKRLNNLNKQIAKEQSATDFIQGITAGYAEILSFLDTLQESEIDLEEEIDKTVNECTDEYNFDWDKFALHFYELGKNAKYKKPSEDLEEAAEQYTQEMLESWKFDSTGLRPIREPFIAGAEWQKEQMLKEAKDGYVSGIIIHNDGDEEHYAVTYPNGERPHSITDKVKIIVIKEDDK